MQHQSDPSRSAISRSARAMSTSSSLLCRDRKGEHCVKPKAGLLENPLW
jgi:hypothetical protein